MVSLEHASINSMATATSTVTSTVTEVAAEMFASTPLPSPSVLSVDASGLSSKFSFLPSTPQDLLLFPLRIVYRTEVFLFVTIPRNIMQMLGLEDIIASVVDSVSGTGSGGDAIQSNITAAAAAMTATGAEAPGATGGAENASTSNVVDLFVSIRKFGGFFSYMTSKWSLTCFAVALILNRVTIYASTRRHISLNWDRRLALRIVPMALFVWQIITLLRGIRCQVSSEYSVLRYGKPGKHSNLDYSGEGGFLYSLSSSLLFWEDERASCSAVKMGRPIKGPEISYGSFSLLWPVFLLLCFSHFVETLSCALQGRPPVTEAGMSIFEHSLAFAEAETMLSQSIGLGLFGITKPSSDGAANSGAPPAQLFSRMQILERLNITPELLLVCLISCCNSLTSNILDVAGLQNRYRFFNTAFWGLCYMGSMVFGLLDSSPLWTGTGVFKFPTVCIVGFIPHLLILIGISVCACIYGLALLITAFSLPSDIPPPASLRERFALAHENMQGASHIRNVRINLHEDFYTTLVRIGYTALTAASEAVFLNEGKTVVARRMTWLEEDRLAEIEALRGQPASRSRRYESEPPESFRPDDTFNFNLPERGVEWESGYNREQKFDKPPKSSRSMDNQSVSGGVGAFRNVTRCYHGFTFFRGIFMLLLRWSAYGFIKLLERVGISNPPQWLAKLGGVRRHSSDSSGAQRQPSLDFWILSDQGELELPENNEFDVEKEMRKRESANRSTWTEAEESNFDRKLYNWWKVGGSWGDQDESGDYRPPQEDWDDTTSVLSMSTNDDASEWESYESDGRRTPTQEEPYIIRRRRYDSAEPNAPSQEALLDSASLARLLDPKDKESKHEARILASHLAAGHGKGIMTRSQFQKQMERERARVLTSNRYHSSHVIPTMEPSEKKRPTPEEESEILENLILSRRLGSAYSTSHDGETHRSRTTQQEPESWATGASGLGPDGPQCVICQAAPRSIITWPCRCLCICEDCRVSLAMNNFGSCVTCRREVGGFVRLWVP